MFSERQTSLSWLVAGTLVTLTHVAIGAALIYEQASKTPPSPPPQAAAIAINMVPPPPEQTTPEPKPEPEPLPKAPPEHDAVIPEPEPEPEPEETPEPEPEPEPQPEPPSEPVESENLEGVSNPSENIDARVDWQGRLLIHLEQHKRYPRMARRRHLEGVAQIEFEMDRNGQVHSARIKKSSGHSMLDKETENLLKRAQPLPKPPEAVQGERITLIVPVEFELR